MATIPRPAWLSTLNPRTSLRARLAFIFGVLPVAAFLAAAVFAGFAAQARIEREFRAALGITAHRLLTFLEEDFEERRGDLVSVSGFPAFADPAGSDERRRPILHRLAETHSEYAWLGFVSPEGRVRVGTHGVLEGVDVSSREWFKAGRERPAIAAFHEPRLIAPVLRELGRAEPTRVADIAVPVKDAQGRLLGVLAAHLDVRWIAARLAQVRGEHEEAHGSALPLRLAVLDSAGEPLAGDSTVPEGSAVSEAVRSTPGSALAQLNLRIVAQAEDAALRGAVRRSLVPLAAAGVLTSLLLIMTAWIVAGGITRDLRRTAAAAHRAVRGDESAWPALHFDDEVDQMVADLRLAITREHDAEDRFRRLLNLSAEYYWRTDAEHRLVSVEGNRIPGDFAAYIGKRRWELPAVDMAEEDWAAHRRVLDARLPYRDFQLRIRLSDGKVRAYSVSGEPVFAADGAFVGYQGVTDDITERLEREREIERLNATLEQRVAERTRELSAAIADLESFSYTVSHDLKVPLRALNGFTAMLREELGTGLPGDAERHMQRISQAADTMSELIDDMLALARVSRQPLRVERVHLGRIATEIAQELERGNGGRRVEWDIDDTLVVQGDAALLRSAMHNLLANAWKYSSKLAVAHIAFGRRPEEEGGEFFVRDDGAGFDMAYAGKLFQPFSRLHGPAEFPGTGVGLAAVLRILRRHGGSIRAESSPGAGATFYFTLA